MAVLFQIKIRKKVDKALSYMDAAELYNRWYLDASPLLGKCTDIRKGGPPNLMPSFNEIQPTPAYPELSHCGFYYTRAACQRARQVLASWDVDFKWSVAQHRLGAGFGSDHCRPKPKGRQNPFADACKVLDKE